MNELDPNALLCLKYLSDNTCSIISTLASWLNSNFSTALLGSLAGAFAGAVAAQRIVEASKTRDERLKELRNTNAAAMACFTTCNAALALKRQHVKPLYDQYQVDKVAVLNFKAERATGQRQGNAEYRFVSDLRTFPAPTIPIDSLRLLLFDRLSVTGRPLALVCAVEDAIVGLRNVIEMRLALIARIKSQEITKEQLPAYYFGFPLVDGDTNQEYPDLVAAIHSYVDDLAFFSYLLCCDLTAHAKKLHSQIPKRQRKDAPVPTEADFSKARATHLIPPDSEYSDWLKAFPEAKSSEK